MNAVDRRGFMTYITALIGCTGLDGLPFKLPISIKSSSSISLCSCGTGMSSHNCNPDRFYCGRIGCMGHSTNKSSCSAGSSSVSMKE